VLPTYLHFVSEGKLFSTKNALINNSDGVFGRKLDLVGTFKVKIENYQ